MSYSEFEAGSSGTESSDPDEIADRSQQSCGDVGLHQNNVFQRTAESLLALGTKVKDWYSTHSSRGYLPNLHIDE